jgi:hypothetical protein
MIILNCPNLRSMSLAHTKAISTFWVIEILKKLKLESLALFGWDNANSSTLRVIGPHLGELQFLCITGCRRVTAAGIVGFVRESRLKVVKFLETKQNDAMGRLNQEIMEGLRERFPRIVENPPGTLNLNQD